MIKISAGTAHVLGMKKLAIDALPTTAYLLGGEKCSHNCGFCPQARSSSARADMLSRITWSEGDVTQIAVGIAAAYRGGQMKRACFQVVDGYDLKQVGEMVKKVRAQSDIPVCVSAKVKAAEELIGLVETGVERIGLALDAASERVYKGIKTGSWTGTLKLIEDAAKTLPGRISTHLIVGLGETEEEMVNVMQYMWDMDVLVGLFAFTPIPGTRMAAVEPPKLAAYRRIQVVNYLLAQKIIKKEDCIFNQEGQLKGYGLTAEKLRSYLQDGRAFQTSGCPDCNRPYYNEKPGGVMYNYPRPLKQNEIAEAVNLVIDSLEDSHFEHFEQ